MSPAPTLAIISKVRMATKLENAISLLQSLHGMAIDKSARKNLKRAIISTQNALRIYEHHSLKTHIKPQKKMPNPQQDKYRWHK